MSNPFVPGHSYYGLSGAYTGYNGPPPAHENVEGSNIIPLSHPTLLPVLSVSSHIRIGFIHYTNENGRQYSYECGEPACSSTFGRPQELTRHWHDLHDLHPPTYPCEVLGCSRGEHGRPFHRRDKLSDHVRAVHP
jgi:hypothetical protein